LESVKLPEGLTSIADSLFNDCKSLKAITIPEHVTVIDKHSFFRCQSLKDLHIGKCVEKIAKEAFWYCSALEKITVDSENPNYSSPEGTNVIVETATNVLLKGVATSVIPPFVTEIGAWAFTGCVGLKSVEIPVGVVKIGEAAFLNAKHAILEKANRGYNFEELESFMIEEFSKFIKDGHFSINDKCVFLPLRKKIYQNENKEYDYAVRTYEVEGIPVFDIKKFYYDNDEEQAQLDAFAKSGERYKNAPCLIFDLRQNRGGSDTYLYDFLVGMNGEAPDFPIDFRQMYSDTFIEWLANECDMHGFEQGIDEEKSDGKILETAQKIIG
jgi:hypothetical protein